MSPPVRQRLDTFNNASFNRGRSRIIELAWLMVQAALFASDIPGSAWRRFLLRMFGAKVGDGVVIKPRVRVKFPWRLEIGAQSWIGEGVWIDNLATVSIGTHACISQGAYFCTGNHDWTASTFDLRAQTISVGDHAWVCAMATLLPGARLAEGSILLVGARLSGSSEPDSIYDGCPARKIAIRN